MGHDDHRVDDDSAVVLEHWHEVLSAEGPQRAAIAGIVLDPLDLESLVGGRQRDALDVGGKRDPVDARHGGRACQVTAPAATTSAGVGPKLC